MCLIHQVRCEGTRRGATGNSGTVQSNCSTAVRQIDRNRSVLQVILGLAGQQGTDVSGIAGVIVRLIIGSRRSNRNGVDRGRLSYLGMSSRSRQTIVNIFRVNNSQQREHHGKRHAERYEAPRNHFFHMLSFLKSSFLHIVAVLQLTHWHHLRKIRTENIKLPAILQPDGSSVSYPWHQPLR